MPQPGSYPLTSQPRLPAADQKRLDAVNYDAIVQFQKGGGSLDAEQVEIFKELSAKLGR